MTANEKAMGQPGSVSRLIPQPQVDGTYLMSLETLMRTINKILVGAAVLVGVGGVMGFSQERGGAVVGGISGPGKNDPRYAALYSEKIEKLEINNLTVNEICDRAKLPSRLRCSVVIRGKAKDMRASLRFRGGSLKDFLDVLMSEIPISISFNELSVVIERRADKLEK